MVRTPIISVHVPKTAGTSLRHIFGSSFGKDKIFEDYSDDPVDPESKINQDPSAYDNHPKCDVREYQVIHSHFSPAKYQGLSDAVFVTFLRHPIENLISIYWFWRKLPRGHHSLHDRFLDSNISFLDFVSLPCMRYLYSRTYFATFNMDRFDFIGDYSNFGEEVKRLAKIIDVKLNNVVFLNRNENTTYLHEKKSVLNNVALMKTLGRLLEDDIEFFHAFKGK